MSKHTQFSEFFYQKLPHKPYCTNDLGYGLHIRPKRIAVKMPYIQHNPPCHVASLVFDVDRADAFFSWSDENLPPPTWITKNPTNCHAHLGYMLATPVCTTEHASHKAIEYLAKIQAGIARKLGADVGYTGLITKNPCHTAWESHFFDVEPYELNYLADFVELRELSEEKEVNGLGRNCIMFDIVRFWAYKAIRAFISGSPDGWYQEVLKMALNANGAFLEPLPYSEVKATAKSIAKWVWRNHGRVHGEFIERQAERGRKGGLSSDSSHGGKARSAQYSDIRQEALKLHIMGKSIKEISEYLNVHRNSVSKWVKIHAQVQA